MKAKHLDYMYDDYDKRVRRIVPVYEEMNQIILDTTKLDKIKPNILDLGIGAGYLSFRLLQKIPSGILDGVDYEEKILKKAKNMVSSLTNNFKLFNQNMIDFMFNKKYDIVVSVLAIHHLTDEEKEVLFSKIYQNMNSNGFLIIGDAYHMVPESKNQEMLNWWKTHLKHELGDKKGEKFFQDTLKSDIYSKKGDQINWLENIGFSEVKFIWHKYNYAVLVARK